MKSGNDSLESAGEFGDAISLMTNLFNASADAMEPDGMKFGSYGWIERERGRNSKLSTPEKRARANRLLDQALGI